MEWVYGLNRRDKSDAQISVVHGIVDTKVLLQGAEKLRDHYQGTVVYYEFYQLDGADHGAWNWYYEGKSHGELSVDFITKMLDLNAAANLHLAKRSFQIWRKPF